MGSLPLVKTETMLVLEKQYIIEQYITVGPFEIEGADPGLIDLTFISPGYAKGCHRTSTTASSFNQKGGVRHGSFDMCPAIACSIHVSM